MKQTFMDFIRTNAHLKIEDQNFSNEIISEEVLNDGDLTNINLLNFNKGVILIKLVKNLIRNYLQILYFLVG